MAYDKPFKTYDEQITKLQNDYGLMINDIEFAKHALISISYYDLVNGYKSTLMENGKFKPGLSIEYLYELYLLDKSIQAFIMKYSLFIENMFKNLLAYSIASSFGVDETKYLDTNNYQSYNSGISFKDNVLSEILPLLTNTTKCKMPTKHYKENHNHIPPWILFKNISFGDAINLFCVLNRQEKEPITDTLFENAPGKDQKQPLNIDKAACKGLYSTILIILLFLKTPYLKALFITEFKNTIFNNPTDEQNQLRRSLFSDYCKLTSLPSNILDRLSKFQQTLS